MAEFKCSDADALRTGVYCITNTVNGKKYVGSASATFSQRWKAHRVALRRGKHHSQHLQRAWDMHGEEAFIFQIAAFCDPSICVAIEQLWINCLRAADKERGYNVAPTAGSRRGAKHTQESIARMKSAKKGNILTPEHRAKVAAALTGRRLSPEHRAKLTGRKFSEAHIENLRVRVFSDEHRARLSEAAKKREEIRRNKMLGGGGNNNQTGA